MSLLVRVIKDILMMELILNVNNVIIVVRHALMNPHNVSLAQVDLFVSSINKVRLVIVQMDIVITVMLYALFVIPHV
jgi:hypothetical protein